MSAEPETQVERWTPPPHDTEVDRFRREDPDFPVTLAKARARGRGQPYQPDRHGPFEPKMVPRKERQKRTEEAAIVGDLSALMKRFGERGAGNGRHLKAVPTTRLDEVIQR